MTAAIIDGKALADKLRARTAIHIRHLKAAHGFVPGLAVVLVGEDPASRVYVRNKARQSEEIGMRSIHHALPADTEAAALVGLIKRLNADPGVDGILVQLPLPPQIDPAGVIDAIDPAKDVDGFHVINAGRLATGAPTLIPCTPLGCMLLLGERHSALAGLNAVVIGRSNIVGKPVAQLLLAADCTVTMAHSKTRNLPAVCRGADILIAAVGRPEMVRGDWIKPGATVIDVGINRIASADGKGRLVGDVAFAEALDVAGAVTPVPGGAGPMTIACLLQNAVTAACARRGIVIPTA
ncbi:MAG: bifunctional methylenetetrahydrofolate dehydrogenase/methenyltetrahydrofolate cyclohydrolase FolD [Rhodospirillales bacterium]|nr:bifunctional methylenetetrahydrofolate dehydrogenase/methenyltetrahydrofolate cyclohydrolase FolD [Rhodospirillales bacterium]